MGLKMIVVKLGTVIIFDYINWQGESSSREVYVKDFCYGSNEYHPEPQMLLHGLDIKKNEFRMFAVKDMTDVKQKHL